MEQNREPKLNPHLHSHLIFDKEGKNIKQGKDSLFNKWCLRKCMQKMKSDHLLTPYTRIKSKLMKDLNVKLKTIKILEENIGSKIMDTSHSNIFSDMSPWARETKEKNK